MREYDQKTKTVLERAAYNCPVHHTLSETVEKNTSLNKEFKDDIREKIRLNPDQNLFNLFKNEIIEDYKKDRVFRLNGWYMSLTECYLIELNSF